jgi:peptide/nickel transport system permease protein
VAALTKLLVRILIVASVVFFVVRAVPLDPALAIAGPAAGEQELRQLRILLGLDRPLWEQYLIFLERLAFLDFGESISFGISVGSIIWSSALSTLILAALAVAQGLLIYASLITCYVFLASSRWRPLFSRLVGIVGLAAIAVPSFVAGALFLVIFGAVFSIFPISGPPAAWPDRLAYMVVPSLLLALPGIVSMTQAGLGRVADMLDSDWCQALMVLGFPRGWSGIMRYIVHGVYPLTIAYLGNLMIYVFSGAVVIEIVFTLPGIGETMLSALRRGDYPVVEAVVIVTATFLAFVQWLSVILTQNMSNLPEKERVDRV